MRHLELSLKIVFIASFIANHFLEIKNGSYVEILNEKEHKMFDIKYMKIPIFDVFTYINRNHFEIIEIAKLILFCQ